MNEKKDTAPKRVVDMYGSIFVWSVKKKKWEYKGKEKKEIGE